MSIQPAAAKKPGLLRRMRHYRNIYLMLLPVIIFYILFHYVPMGGLAIAFENYKPAKGILGSDWVGLKNFRKFLTGIYAWRVIRNTLTLNLLLLLFGFPAPILLALMINEMRENWYKKTIQTVSYMPHFVALVVVCGLLREFCLTTGLINDIIAFFGGTRVNLLSSLDHYRTVYVVSNIWQNIGWNSIIYLSALVQCGRFAARGRGHRRRGAHPPHHPCQPARYPAGDYHPADPAHRQPDDPGLRKDHSAVQPHRV